jgi:cardiolipin synthase
VGSALSAALTNRRTLGPTEAGLLTVVAIVMIVIAVVGASFPRMLAWPIALLAAWFGLAWAWKAWTLWRRKGATEHVRERTERPVVPQSGEPRP